MRLSEIIREDGFDEQLQTVCQTISRGDAFISGVEWTLARNPRKGIQETKNVWYITSRNTVEFGNVIVTYTFDEQKEKVYLLGIKK